jgi:ABC-2 type transport system permease protein
MKQKLLHNLRAVIGRSYPRIIGSNREPSWLFYDTALPLLSVTAFVFVYRTLNAPPEYTGFVILGGVMLAFWSNVLWSMGAQLFWEKQDGNLELYMMAPCSRVAILLGMAVGGLFATTIRAIVTTIVGVVFFGVIFDLSRWPMVLLVFALTMVALYGMGMLFASLFVMWGREAWHINNLLMDPVNLASGMYFPVRAFGQALGFVFSMIPLTPGLDAMRQLMFPGQQIGLVAVEYEIAILAVLAVFFPLLAVRALHYMERMAKVEGRLTLRWQ